MHHFSRAQSTVLGTYLLHDLPEAEEHIREALLIQAGLLEKGTYKSIGSIMLEQGWVGEDLLQRCLLRQIEERLAETELFEALPADALMRLARECLQTAVPAGTVIFNRGDKGDSFFIIVSGRVAVTRTEEDGAETTLVRSGTGQGIGERSLFTGADRTATVTALERTVLIQVPKAAFDALVAADPAVSQGLVRVLAERLMKSTDWIARVRADEGAYRQFISEQTEKHEPRLIGSAPAIREVLAKIEQAAQGDGQALICGEEGTELWDAAALIHRKRQGPKGLFTYDAGCIARQQGLRPAAVGVLKLSDGFSQMTALFGREEHALSSGRGRRLGLLQLADAGTLIIEHVEALNPKVQEQVAAFLTTGVFKPLGDKTAHTSRARILCTTTADLWALAAQGRFSRRLLSRIGERVITVPPLRKRKKDLREIVEHLIARNRSQGAVAVTGVGEDAYKEIMASDWPGNMDELNNAVRRAVSLCRGGVITAEHLFMSPPPVTGQVALDLFKIAAVREFFLKSGFPRAAQFAVAAFMALVVGLGLFGSQDPRRNAAIVLTWGYWEPMIVLGSVFFARFWCAVCPIGAGGHYIGKRAGLRKKVPLPLLKYGVYLTAAGIALIFWARSAAHIEISPKATALLVLSIVLLGSAVGLLYERRAWCRYLCPLGGLVGFLARCSAVELRSNYNICQSVCTEHTCYTGNAAAEGCPLFEGPFSLRTNQDCVLCGNCVRLCPERSPVLNLRIPGQELWASHQIERGAVVIGATLLGTQLFRGAERAGLFGSLSLSPLWWFWAASAIFLLILAVMAFAVLAGRGSMSRIIYTFVPLVATGEMAFHLDSLLTLTGMLPELVAWHLTGAGGAVAVPVVTAGGIKVLQVVIMLFGLAGSLYLGRRLSRFTGPAEASPRWLSFALALLMTGLFLAAARG